MTKNHDKDSRAAGVEEKIGENPATLCIDHDVIDYGEWRLDFRFIFLETCKERAGTLYWSLCYQSCSDDREICVGSPSNAVKGFCNFWRYFPVFFRKSYKKWPRTHVITICVSQRYQEAVQLPLHNFDSFLVILVFYRRSRCTPFPACKNTQI